MIQTLGLTKSFGTLRVLDALDLTIGAGEVVAFVGPSGCGKTTLLRCITGLEDEYDGRIILEAMPSREYLEHKRIAVVLQAYSNFHWLKVADNVRTSFMNSTNGSMKEHAQTVDALLTDLGIFAFRNSFMNELSGGMQQRVAIARALAQQTSILALDEPFGALDVRNRHALQMLFKELNRRFRRTVLLVTHDLDEALYLSDRVMVLSKAPARIIQEYKCPFKEETDYQIRYNAEFVSMKKQIEQKLFEL